MRRAILVTTVLAALLAPGAASAAIPPNAAFEDNVHTIPGGYTPDLSTNRVPGSYQTYDIHIAPGMTVGKFVVHIEWESMDDDWDMYVYKMDDPDADPTAGEPGTLVAPAASAGGTTNYETAVYAPSQPMAPGLYRVFVDNWSAADNPATQPNWVGTITFQEFLPGNKRPSASLSGPDRAEAGKPVTFDASKSTDSDGQVVHYAWDLDRDGLFETNGGTSPTLTRTFAQGTNIVGVRVIDNGGAADYASKRLVIGSGSRAAEDCRPDRTSARKARVSRRGAFNLTLLCPNSQAFRGTVTIDTARRVNLAAAKRVRLGSGKFSSKAGASKHKVRVKLSRRGRRALRRLGSTRVVARVALKLADGRTSQSAFRFFLAPPRTNRAPR